MKLYREEVSPLVDLVIDVSASMFVDQKKSIRSLELFYFCIESARHSDASLHVFAADGHEFCVLTTEQAVAADDFLFAVVQGRPDLARIPWRQGSLRILLSDLLFPGPPGSVITALASGKGRGLILAPFSADEANPGWLGNVALTDCETKHRRLQRVTAPLLARYGDNYRRHFSLWRDQARKQGIVIAQVGSDDAFRDALQTEALPRGAVEFY